jgi:hypothetical protein
MSYGQRTLHLGSQMRGRSSGVALLVLLVAAACQGSGFQYVSNSDTSTYFKLPEEWKLYKQDVPSVYTTYFVAFDGAPKPSPNHLLSPNADHPFGLAQVRILTDKQKASWSLVAMRNFDLPIDQLVEQQRAELISEDNDVVLEGGVHGIRVVYNVRHDEGTMTISQTSLVDPTTRVFYQFIIGCEIRCYSRNQDTIEQVVNSWTIEER